MGEEQAAGRRESDFLVERFNMLRDDLVEQLGSPTPPERRATVRREIAIYDHLVDALTERRPYPTDADVRPLVERLAQAADEANSFEPAVLEHRAFAQLLRVLPSE